RRVVADLIAFVAIDGFPGALRGGIGLHEFHAATQGRGAGFGGLRTRTGGVDGDDLVIISRTGSHVQVGKGRRGDSALVESFSAAGGASVDLVGSDGAEGAR